MAATGQLTALRVVVAIGALTAFSVSRHVQVRPDPRDVFCAARAICAP